MMANEFDLNEIKNKSNDENGLNRKLSAFEEKDEVKEKPEAEAEEKDANAEAVAEKTSDEEPVGEAAPQEEKKVSKADFAKMIAARLSENDDSEQPQTAAVKTAPAPAAVKKPVEKPVRERSEKQTVKKEEAKPEKEKEKKKPKKKESSSRSTVGIVLAFVGGLVVVALLAFYVGGLVMTSGKFLPGTTINGVDVSMMNAKEAAVLFEDKDSITELTFMKSDGTSAAVPFSKIDYEADITKGVQSLLDKKNSALWFTCLIKPASYTFDENAFTYNENKLKRELGYIRWESKDPVDAYISSSDDGLVIVPEEDGFSIDLDKLFEYTAEQLSEGNTYISTEYASVPKKASVVSADLKVELERMKALENTVITIDFDYTTETLTGADFAKWITYNEDGSYTVDRTKVEGYVEELAKKYDTYNTPRKFNATLQGEITVPVSADAYYGWWIYKDETTDLLVKLIEEGKTVTTDPVYYYQTNADGTKGYVFTGVEEARTAEDDIGDTYVEIDLTAQTLWHYVDGEVVYKCGIVSGQLNPEARKTLPGVYKVWFKARNYNMVSSNSAGESWSSYCSYWTRVSIVGIGLHDSQWRGNNVGGEIYKTNGSHGCINMTLSGAKYIYENVDYGTPVVMYY